MGKEGMEPLEEHMEMGEVGQLGTGIEHLCVEVGKAVP